MPFLRFVHDSFVMLFELVGLLIMLKISAHISTRMKRLTVGVIILLAAISVAFRVELATHEYDTFCVLRPILTAFEYSSYPIVLILVMMITVDKKAPWKKMLLLLLPEIVCVPVFFTSQWTGLVFSFSGDNDYVAGPLSGLPYILFSGYCVVFIIHNYIYFKKYTRMNRIIPIYITASSVVGMTVYRIVDGAADYSALFTSAILLYFLCIYIHVSKIDTLTHLLNRQSYYQDLKSYDDKITGVVSVDMNDLKYLNDNFGHEAGDIALKTVSEVMWANAGRGTVYRVGGDEFIIIYLGADEIEISHYVDRMRNAIGKTDYTCAFGYAMKTRGVSVEEAFREADDKMYADKSAIKLKKKMAGDAVHTRD